MVPPKGWSSIDKEGSPCYDDPEADAPFVRRLKEKLNNKEAIEEADVHLYTPEFARKGLDEFIKMYHEHTNSSERR